MLLEVAEYIIISARRSAAIPIPNNFMRLNLSPNKPTGYDERVVPILKTIITTGANIGSIWNPSFILRIKNVSFILAIMNIALTPINSQNAVPKYLKFFKENFGLSLGEGTGEPELIAGWSNLFGSFTQKINKRNAANAGIDANAKTCW